MRKFLLLLVLCLSSVGATFAQIKISGKVVDAETGQPLIGATVMIGTTTGVATLADGTYVLPVPASAGEHPVLTFTYIGYESLNVTVGKNHVVNAKLKPEVVIDQIVVTGFKNAKKESFTGSSVKISADDVAIAGVTDVSRMLEGQVAGVSVQNVSSTFGSAPKVRIRGVTSLSGENKPLWVVDGVVLEDVVNISNDQLSSGDPTTLLGSSVDIIKKYGHLDILVNNAGITRDNLVMKMNDEEFDAVYETNLKGVFHTIHHTSRYFLKQKSGRIINISSVSGITGNAGQANYCAAKAGVIGLTKSVARELSSRGITANLVAPGMIETDMTKDLPDTVKENMLHNIPLGRIGKPEEIAAAVAFLASEEAGYITGQVLAVDGGMTM